MQNAPRGAFCNISTFIKLPFYIKIFVLYNLSVHLRQVLLYPWHGKTNNWVCAGRKQIRLRSAQWSCLGWSEYSCDVQQYSWLSHVAVQIIFQVYMYSKTCLKRPLSKRPKLVLKTNYRLMQVKSIAEWCSKGSILQDFRPSLSYYLPLRTLFCLFLVAVLDRFYWFTLIRVTGLVELWYPKVKEEPSGLIVGRFDSNMGRSRWGQGSGGSREGSGVQANPPRPRF